MKMAIPTPGANQVSPQYRSNQITITLSDKALEEYRLVAQWKNQPVATVLKEVLEQHHLSPSFSNAVKRAKCELEMTVDGFQEAE